MTSCFQGGEAAFGGLIRGASVAVEIVSQRFEHHPLRRGHPSQQGQLIGVEGARIAVREQSCFREDGLGGGVDIVDGRFVSVLIEPCLLYTSDAADE